jgi:hypothetical protein
MSTYSDPKYGLKRRVMANKAHDFVSTGKQEGVISFNTKTKIFKFGIVPWATLIRASSTAQMKLETEEGTALGTWNLSGGEQSLGAGDATGASITATTVAAGRSVAFNLVEAGSSGSFFWFVDIAEKFDADAADGGGNI